MSQEDLNLHLIMVSSGGGGVPLREGDGGSFRRFFVPFIQVLVRSRSLFINYLCTPGPIFKFLSILGNNLLSFALGSLKLGFLPVIGCKK